MKKALIILAILTSGTIATVGILKLKSTNSHRLIGGQKDAHGCIIPAGYSWCEEKQKCLRVWEEKCE